MKEIPKIRTFKTDAEIFIKEKNLSRLDITRSAYAAGEEGPARPAGGLAEKLKLGLDWKKITYSALAVLIIALAGYFVFKLFFAAPTEPQPEAPKPAAASFLPVEDKKELVFSKSDPGSLISALLDEKQKGLRFDTVIYFPFGMTSQDFVALLSWNPPAGFADNLNPDFNTLIAYGQASSDLAIIFKARGFERALASLLEWEHTIWFDWKPFLAEEDIKNIARFSWADDIIKNNDARVLKNGPPSAAGGGGGKIILGYAIFNKQYVIISTSREALATILERLIALPPR
ncbi:MAG: hypothetical protein HYW15_00650 [Candidatus Giovannonibacteria bacterium]|nr:MAG: hypothetical protein HYW15_00650 [Candidatus Giovannonibacteria bacterium]